MATILCVVILPVTASQEYLFLKNSVTEKDAE